MIGQAIHDVTMSATNSVIRFGRYLYSRSTHGKINKVEILFVDISNNGGVVADDDPILLLLMLLPDRSPIPSSKLRVAPPLLVPPSIKFFTKPKELDTQGWSLISIPNISFGSKTKNVANRNIVVHIISNTNISTYPYKKEV